MKILSRIAQGLKTQFNLSWGQTVCRSPIDKREQPQTLAVAIVKKNAGQVVIEYVLLMVILASLGAVIMRSIGSRNADEPGIIVDKWDKLLRTIAKDNPED